MANFNKLSDTTVVQTQGQALQEAISTGNMSPHKAGSAAQATDRRKKKKKKKKRTTYS